MAEIKKKRKVKKSLVKIVSIVVIGVSIYLLYGVGAEVIGMIDLKNQADAAQTELQKLQDENASLISKRDKLEDPNYVSTYARGNYMFSKDGEQIFYLPGSSETTTTEPEPSETPTPSATTTTDTE